MRLVGLLLAVLLVGGCGLPDHQPTRPSPAPERPLSLAQVAKAACFGKPIRRTPQNELEFFTSGGASCGQSTTVAMFDGPGARDSYTSMAASNLILQGKNWVVWIDQFNNRALYRKVQAQIGGQVIGGKR